MTTAKEQRDWWSKQPPGAKTAMHRAWQNKKEDVAPKAFWWVSIFYAARKRARDKGLPFSLTRTQMPPMPDVCPVLGLALDYKTKGKRGYRKPNSPSLDRVDSSKGYTYDNVEVISWRANDVKGNATREELLAVAEHMK